MAEREIASDFEGRPYRVCRDCAVRLENLALRPLEWYRLAALHGPDAALLHDDFYNEDGAADQNRMPVKHAALFPIPKLSSVASDLRALLDYGLTRWNLREDVLDSLRAHPHDKILAALSELTQSRPVFWVDNYCYRIAARVLKENARSWIDSRWEQGATAPTMSAFLEAAASCLDKETALPRALAAVEHVGNEQLSRHALSLEHFQSPEVLDWIERKVASPVLPHWGQLAASNGFDWKTATRWIDAGRPLSLVALDALKLALTPPPVGRPDRLTIKLPGAPDSGTVMRYLKQYAVRDPAPRVTQIVDRIADAQDSNLDPN